MVTKKKVAAKDDGRWKAVGGKPLQLNLACGDRKHEDHIGIDKFKTDSTDYTFDLLTFPWPCDDGVVEGILCSHFFEHIPGMLRPRFMDECYRVMKAGAKMTVVVPDGDSHRAVQDYTHQWPPVVPESFLYFNKEWRTREKLTHGDYAMTCDFDFGYGYALDGEISLRNAEQQQFAIKHYRNHSNDLIVTLTRR